MSRPADAPPPVESAIEPTDTDLLLGLLEQNEIGLMALDHQRRVIFFNRWISAASGIPVERALGHPLERLFPSVGNSRLRSAVDDALAHGLPGVLSPRLNPHPLPLFHRDAGPDDPKHMGQQILVKPLRLPGRNALCLIQVQEITAPLERERLLREQTQELKRLAGRIRDEQTHLQAVLDNALNAILVVGSDGVVRSCNPAAQRIFQYERGDMVGLHFSTLAPELAGQTLEGMFQSDDQEPHPGPERRRQRRRRFEAVGRRRDGLPAPLEIAASMVQLGQQQMAVVIIRDMSGQKRTEADLKRAREAADNANRAKSQFLANMSHEIRTPMNAIIGLSDLLGEMVDEPEARQAIEVLRRNGSALLELINDILDLSKVEAGQVRLEKISFNLKELVAYVVADFQEPARSKGIRVTGWLDPDVAARRSGDPGRLRQVLINLVGNAVKFTNSGAVSIRITRASEGDATPNRVHFSVADTGIGIPNAQQQRIFDAFSQADSSTTRRFGGTGLGLAISRELVELMGGRLGVESAEGEGSRFHFAIPLWIERPGEAAPATRPAAPEAAPPEERREGRKGLDILLAEDSEDNVLLVRLYLKKSPHRLTVVENGAEAVEAFKKGRFDLVLMDLQMPVMDGFSATRALRDWEVESRRSRTPIIALTAFALKEDRQQSLAAGCDLHLTKPVKKQGLLEAIAGFDR